MEVSKANDELQKRLTEKDVEIRDLSSAKAR